MKYRHMVIACKSGVGFGIYLPRRDAIYVGGVSPVVQSRRGEMLSVCTTMAHEYRHHLQRCARKRYDEADAARFAVLAVRTFQGLV